MPVHAQQVSSGWSQTRVVSHVLKCVQVAQVLQCVNHVRVSMEWLIISKVHLVQ